jgi:hypothetical protein
VQDVLLQRREVGVVGDPLGLVEAGQGAQQVAGGVAQLAIGVGGGGQDGLADPLVLGIVDHRRPQPQDLGAALLGDGLGLDGVALGLGHLLAVLVLGEPVGEDALVRRAAARAAALQQRRLEPAAVLVGAFQIEVGGRAAVVAAFQGEGVGRAAVEPDVEDVDDLLEPPRIAVAQEVAVGQLEPGVAAAVLDGVEDAAVDRLVHQRDAGLLVDEHGQGRAPGALAADQPVGTGLDHRPMRLRPASGWKAVSAMAWTRSRAGSCRPGSGRRLVHADEPLRGVAEDHRGLGAPAVRIAVLDAAAGQQVAGLDQLVHDRAVGGPELAGLLALGLDDLQAREQRHVREIGAVGIDGVGDGVQRVAALQPDQ